MPVTVAMKRPCFSVCAQIPVVSLEHLSEAQARAYMLADNKLTDRSSWDDEALALQLKELTDLALDFDIEAIGFEPPEIDLRIQSLDMTPEDAADDFEVAAGPVVSKPGDLWLLDSHRLYCGSALDLAAYNAVLAGEKAAAAFTDPPYNVKINGHASGKGKITHREFPMAAGEMTEAEFTSFLQQALGHLSANCREGALIYSCMDWRHMGEILAAARGAGLDLLNLCVWAKNNGGMGTLYRSRHELIFVFKNGKAPHLNNVQLGRFGRNRSNVWNYPGANSFSRKKGRPASRSPSHREADRARRRRDPRLHGARRHRARCLRGQRNDDSRRRAHRQTLLRHRARPAVCRYGDQAMATIDRQTKRITARARHSTRSQLSAGAVNERRL